MLVCFAHRFAFSVACLLIENMLSRTSTEKDPVDTTFYHFYAMLLLYSLNLVSLSLVPPRRYLSHPFYTQ
jgi:hypothetical protein